jgi:hypothetical protein
MTTTKDTVDFDSHKVLSTEHFVLPIFSYLNFKATSLNFLPEDICVLER